MTDTVNSVQLYYINYSYLNISISPYKCSDKLHYFIHN